MTKTRREPLQEDCCCYSHFKNAHDHHARWFLGCNISGCAGQKVLFGGGFLTPPSMWCELVTLLIILEPTSTIRSSGIMLKWDPSPMHPETARGENFNRNSQNSFFFSSVLGGLGRILRSCEQWMDDCSVSLKMNHSLNLRLQLRQKIGKLFVVRKSSSAVRSQRSGSSWRQFLRSTTDEQCITTRGC